MSAPRLDAPAATAEAIAEPRLDGPAPGPLDRTCLWCGQAYLSPAPEAEFCGQPCRKAFNNLRAMRGAELYDLFMALRHDRAVATAFKVWRCLNRLAAGFRAEDVAQRDGRRSWRHPRVILARRPYLTAETPAAARPASELQSDPATRAEETRS